MDMNLKQFAQLHPQKLFISFYFDIEYQFFKTKHYCLLVKYDNDDKNKSIEMMQCLITSWSSLQNNAKHVIRGYGEIYTSVQAIQQFQQPQKQIVKNSQKDDYFCCIRIG